MANIDTSSIQNFDGMTPEEQVKALLGMEIPEQIDLSKYVAKEIFDKKATEAANAQKQLRAKMTDEEQRKAADDEARLEYEERLKAAESANAEWAKRFEIMNDSKSFLSILKDEKLADETATALNNGDKKTMFTNLKKAFEKALDDQKKSIEAELMSKTPQPDGAGSGSQPAEDPALAFVRRRAAAHADAAKQAEAVRKSFLN